MIVKKNLPKEDKQRTQDKQKALSKMGEIN